MHLSSHQTGKPVHTLTHKQVKDESKIFNSVSENGSNLFSDHVIISGERLTCNNSRQEVDFSYHIKNKKRTH